MRKFLSVLLLIIFILTFPLALFYFNAGRTILSPMYYKNAFEKIDFYNRLSKIDPRVITDYLADKEGRGENPNSGPQTDQFISMLTSTISPDIVKLTVENNVDEIFVNVLEKGKKTMEIDLTPVKESMSLKNTSPQAKEFINQVKEKYTIPIPPALERAQKIIGNRHLMAPLYLGIALFLLLLSAILWPNWKGRLRIPGIVLLILGIIIVPTSFLMKLLPMPGLSIIEIKELSSIIKDLYDNLKSQFYFLYLLEGGGIFLLGLILIIVSGFVPGAKTAQKQVQIPTSPEQKNAAPLQKAPEVPKAEPVKEETKPGPKVKESKKADNK